MLGGLFPNLFGGNENGSTNLSSGGSPENLNGQEKQCVSAYSQLPTKMSKSQVIQAGKVAGDLEAQTVILKEGSAQYLEVQKAALANLEVRVNHSKAAMHNTREFQKKMSRHGKNIHEFQLGSEATKANYDAYEAQFSSIKVDI
jgi:hypothetical protein